MGRCRRISIFTMCWICGQGSGHVIVVRYADDSVVGLLAITYPDPEMQILNLRVALRHMPKAGAVCGSSAYTDLRGGVAGNYHPYRDPFLSKRVMSISD